MTPFAAPVPSADVDGAQIERVCSKRLRANRPDDELSAVVFAMPPLEAVGAMLQFSIGRATP